MGWEFSHLTMQCMWKQCEQAPQTSGQSSPGVRHSGQQFSKAIRQMPQLSSLAIHRHVATPVQPTKYQTLKISDQRASGSPKSPNWWRVKTKQRWMIFTSTFRALPPSAALTFDRNSHYCYISCLDIRKLGDFHWFFTQNFHFENHAIFASQNVKHSD